MRGRVSDLLRRLVYDRSQHGALRESFSRNLPNRQTVPSETSDPPADRQAPVQWCEELRRRLMIAWRGLRYGDDSGPPLMDIMGPVGQGDVCPHGQQFEKIRHADGRIEYKELL